MTDYRVPLYFFVQVLSLRLSDTVYLVRLDAASYIKQLISTYDLYPNKIVSQRYDGANVMSGDCTCANQSYATCIHMCVS